MNKLTKEERIKGLEALLAAGSISQEQFDAATRKIEAQPEPQAARDPRSKPGHNKPPRPGHSIRRSINKDLARAPYRFVEFDAKAVLKAEAAAHGPINDPKEGGLCAEITVEWESETPLLIGEEKEGTVVPVTWSGNPDRKDFIIPGPTLRGAIRSVCEIVAGARLTDALVSTNRTFAVRDFTHRAFAAPDLQQGYDSKGNGYHFQLNKPNNTRAGWLTLTKKGRAYVNDNRGAITKGDDALADAEFEIQPVKWGLVDAQALVRSGWLSRRYRDKKQFMTRPLIEKYAGVDEATLVKGHGNKRTIDTASCVLRFSQIGTRRSEEAIFKPDGKGSVWGHLVFSGPRPKWSDHPRAIKPRYEYMFHSEVTGTPFPVPRRALRAFVEAHSRTVKDKLRPDGSWKTIPRMFANDPEMKLPVFYVDKRDEDGDRFAFGITRLFKVPHRLSLRDVLDKSGLSRPLENGRVDENDLDMVEALFGYVYEGEASGEPGAQTAAEAARRGRVSFLPAALKNPDHARLTPRFETVMMGPNPSFAPFYLKGKWRDYSPPESEGTSTQIAGRKRYPVRTLAVSGQSGEKALAAQLQRQIQNIRDMQRGKEPGDDVKSTLQFLTGANGENPVFESTIRLHNVTRAELALILYALTLGNHPARRHALGRAKPFGAGQTRVKIARLKLQPLEQPKPEVLETPDSKQLEEHIAPLDKHLKSPQADGDFTRLAELRDQFFALCDPGVGDKMHKQGKLDYLRIREPRRGSKSTLFAYRDLRDSTKPASDVSKAPYQGDILEVPRRGSSRAASDA